MKNSIVVAMLLLVLSLSCKSKATADKEKKEQNADKSDTVTTRLKEDIPLPAPYATPSAHAYCEVIGWPTDKKPVAPAGFNVTEFAGDLKNPRWIYIGPNGDIFVSEANTLTSAVKSLGAKMVRKGESINTAVSANRITVFRDANHDGIPETRSIFLSGLNQPFGMLIMGNSFYVGNTDAVMQYPYQPGQLSIKYKGKKIVTLPKGGYNNHWTRNLLASRKGDKIYVTVGSGSNAGEHGPDNEIRRADILEINPDGSGEQIYASGLRNPQGMGWAPGTNSLYVVVNERDELGDDLVPDYMTGVQKGSFYGWPYAYWGKHEDPRLKGQRPDLVKTALVPDVSMGAHTASLGLAFDEQNQMPGKYKGGAFVGQHGSWNRSVLSGYQVAFVPFADGKPSGDRKPFLTGFIADEQNKKVYGRPVGVAFTTDGRMLVADDVGNRIWMVSRNK